MQLLDRPAAMPTRPGLMTSDVLSDVLGAVHLTGALYFDFELSSPWVLEAPPSTAELNREAAARTAGEMKWGSERTWWDSILDVFRQ